MTDRGRRADLGLAALLAGSSAVLAYLGATRVLPLLLIHHLDDFWFDADSGRLIHQMADATAIQRRALVHPLFSLFAYAAATAGRLFALDPAHTARLLVAAAAGLTALALYGVLRLLGCGRLDATLFTLLGATSAWALFGHVVFETGPWAALSALFALGVLARSAARPVPEPWWVLASAATLSFTVTHWLVGLAAAFCALPWRRALQVSVNAFCLVVLLSVVQKAALPRARSFVEDPWGGVLRGRLNLPHAPPPTRVGQSLRAFFIHGSVMPEITIHTIPRIPPIEHLSVQQAEMGSGSPWGRVAVGVWVALLGLGTWGLARAAVPGRVRGVLGVSLGAFAVLHVFYSEETFLFMTLYGPLLVLLAALATRTPARAIALVLAGLLVVGGTLNNARQHKRAVRLLRQESVLLPQGWWGPRVGGASLSAPSPPAGGEPRPDHGGKP